MSSRTNGQAAAEPRAELKQLAEGSDVVVTLDDGTEVRTRTTGQPWRLGHGQWVVKTEATGPGGYDLNRVRAARVAAA